MSKTEKHDVYQKYSKLHHPFVENLIHTINLRLPDSVSQTP